MRNVYASSMASAMSSGSVDEGGNRSMGPGASFNDSPLFKTGKSFRNPMFHNDGKSDDGKVARPTVVPDAIPRKGTIQVDYAEPDWEQQWSDEHQCHYWFDHTSGRSSWRAPLGHTFEPDHQADASHWDLPDDESIPRIHKALSTMSNPNSIHEGELHDKI